jgi:hypothetical protein
MFGNLLRGVNGVGSENIAPIVEVIGFWFKGQE